MQCHVWYKQCGMEEKKMKFTFKKIVNTGRYRSFELDNTQIKLGGRVVGYIAETREPHQYKVSFAIKREKTKENPCSFKWIHLKKRFINENEARELIKRGGEEIQKKYDLYQFEKEEL